MEKIRLNSNVTATPTKELKADIEKRMKAVESAEVSITDRLRSLASSVVGKLSSKKGNESDEDNEDDKEKD